MSKKIPEGIYKKHKFVILDESHKVKGPKTQQTLHLTAVVKQAKYAVLMTGTPIQGKSTIDYFSQVNATVTYFLPSYLLSYLLLAVLSGLEL